MVPMLQWKTRRILTACLWMGCSLVGTGQALHGADAPGGASKPAPQLTLTNVENQYKRVHQFALRLVLLGRFDEARAFLADYVNGHPADAESPYLLGLLECRLGNFDEAADWMRKAIQLGLPPDRVIAGPRSIVNAAAAHPFFRQLLTAQGNRPVHGPLVGNVSERSAAFWFRTATVSRVQVEVSPTPGFESSVRSEIAVTGEPTDYTAVASVSGLKPDTGYHYRVWVDGVRVPGTGDLSFRTFPEVGSGARFRLVFGGGAGYVPPNERMWDTIRTFDPLLLLLLGDNVYIDDPESPVMQQYTYQRRQSRPEWRRLTARSAVFTIWDDHDFSTNDSWGGPEIEVPFWKKNYSWEIYKQNWANPGYGGGASQPGCWYRFQVADVDFVMLDCRYYRTNPKRKERTMLGPVQLAWLKEQLLGCRGTFKVICSSVPWDFRTKGDSLDTWNGYASEREEIFRWIEEHRIEGVLLMSADRHRSDAWRLDRKQGYGFYEFNSSRLTNQHVHPEMTDQGALFSYNKKQSFGLVEFDTRKSDPTVKYSVISIDGEAVHTVTVKRSELGFPKP